MKIRIFADMCFQIYLVLKPNMKCITLYQKNIFNSVEDSLLQQLPSGPLLW